MGVYFAIRKRTWQALITERSKRILLPLVFGIIAIVPLHFLVFQKYYNLPLSYEPHPGHLWFLGNIFLYVLILTPLFFYFKNNQEGGFKKWTVKLMSTPAGPIMLSLLFVLGGINYPTGFV